MKFEALLKRYEENTATPEERLAVEEELEKFRLIEEYLAQEDTGFALPSPAETDAEVKAVRRTITRRTRRTALAVAAAVLALLLLLQYVLLPLANAGVYDEAWYEDSENYHNSEFELMMDTITRLYLPGYRYLGTMSETSGFGRWTLTSSFYGPDDVYLPEFTLTVGSLNVDSREFWELFPAANLMDIYSSEQAISVLERMDESVRVTAAVRFKEEMSFDEVVAFQKEWDDGTPLRPLDISAAIMSDQTFRPLCLSFDEIGIGWGESINDKTYPAMWINPKTADADTFRQHLASRLQYLIDNTRLARKFDPYQDYQKLLEELENDQVTFSGLWVSGTPEKLLELCVCEQVQGMWLQDAFISLY